LIRFTILEHDTERMKLQIEGSKRFSKPILHHRAKEIVTKVEYFKIHTTNLTLEVKSINFYSSKQQRYYLMSQRYRKVLSRFVRVEQVFRLALKQVGVEEEVELR
jgi:hypothetical protein